MMNQYALGIDIGGTSIEYGIVNKKGEVIKSKDFPTKKFPTPESLVNEIYISHFSHFSEL